MSVSQRVVYAFSLVYALSLPVYASDLSRAREFLDQGQYDQAQIYFQCAADSGDLDACFAYGVFLEGIEENDDQTLVYFLRAAHGGHGESQSEATYLLHKAGRVSEAQIMEGLARAQGVSDLHFRDNDSD